MDYYQWKLDEPGNRQGIVLAYDEDDALQMVRLCIEDPNYPIDRIILRWVCSDLSHVFEISEL